MPEPLAIIKVTPRSSATMDETQEFLVVIDANPEVPVIRSVAFGDYKAFSGRLRLASSLADPPLRSDGHFHHNPVTWLPLFEADILIYAWHAALWALKAPVQATTMSSRYDKKQVAPLLL
ncbi:hypothetical protein ROHU_001518 [Labeo rohita]|uniref:Uncharacterized protein n=1 Tax=Labeo rohita TaxID=84645 RepID=A0A498P1E3_LABRO|nr:hypothetical protein ROHU_001518 [Labeo rohita]